MLFRDIFISLFKFFRLKGWYESISESARNIEFTDTPSSFSTETNKSAINSQRAAYWSGSSKIYRG